jgi:hypothetical protein
MPRRSRRRIVASAACRVLLAHRAAGGEAATRAESIQRCEPAAMA